MLTINHIDLYYGDLKVLWDVSFEVQTGEIVVLIGSNGAGKTTVIRTISSLLSPAKGRIEWNGLRIDRTPAHDLIQHGIVQIPEGRRLFLEMSVEENLILGSLHSAARTKRKESLSTVYELFPRLKERRRQIAGTLSGGEQQMTAIGRGLMSRPRLMMLDEPSLGLAPLLIGDILNIIKKINQEGVTILLVEQNVKQSLALCNRAYVLENGRITAEGTGQTLLADDRIKKTFLGI